MHNIKLDTFFKSVIKLLGKIFMELYSFSFY